MLGDAAHTEMVECLQRIAAEIGKPSAILVISAHWEHSRPAITGGSTPALIYDYYGFPEESYQITYPCAGEPLLARKIHEQLQQAGIDADFDERRGFDHGLFIPLKIMYPDADVPCVQLSLIDNLDAARHLELGKALRGLDYENLLVIGSGFSFHNMKAFFAPATAESTSLNERFEAWLADTCASTELSEADRYERLRDWEEAPGARFCHPREEHLLPLQVCYGLAGRPCSDVFQLTILNVASSMYLWRPAGLSYRSNFLNSTSNEVCYVDNPCFAVFSLPLIIWGYTHFVLRGASHAQFDAPRPAMTGMRPAPSDEHHEIVAMFQSNNANAPKLDRKGMLHYLREQMDAMGDNVDFEGDIRPVQANGVPAEWVLAPGADPDCRLLYVHGGAFTMGSPKSHRPITTEYSRRLGVAVLAIDYRLMPENSRVSQA